MVKSILPISTKKAPQLALVATRPYKTGDVICMYAGRKKTKSKKKVIKDKSKTIGAGFYVIDGKNSWSLGPYINTGVKGVPFLKNNVRKEYTKKKGEIRPYKATSTAIPIFAKKDIEIGDEFFLSYGAGYGGYRSGILLTASDIELQKDQIYFRECSQDKQVEFRNFFIS